MSGDNSKYTQQPARYLSQLSYTTRATSSSLLTCSSYFRVLRPVSKRASGETLLVIQCVSPHGVQLSLRALTRMHPPRASTQRRSCQFCHYLRGARRNRAGQRDYSRRRWQPHRFFDAMGASQAGVGEQTGLSKIGPPEIRNPSTMHLLDSINRADVSWTDAKGKKSAPEVAGTTIGCSPGPYGREIQAAD
jgi:hypothetical protein